MLAAASMMTVRVEVAVSPFSAHSIALASSAQMSGVGDFCYVSLNRPNRKVDEERFCRSQVLRFKAFMKPSVRRL
jgi:hypothetical protein